MTGVYPFPAPHAGNELAWVPGKGQSRIVHRLAVDAMIDAAFCCL